MPLALLLAFAAPAAGQTPHKLWGDTGLRVSRASSHPTNAVSVSDGAGGVLVAWEDDRTLSGRSHVYAQRLGPTGTPLWTVDGVAVRAAPDRVSGRPANQLYPAIISDGAGGAIVAWLDDRRFQRDVYVQRVDASGHRLWATNGVPVATACSTEGGCSNSKHDLRMVSDAAGGAIIAWREKRDLSHASVWAQRIDANGTPAWTIDGVPVANGPFSAYYPSIAADAAGGAFIAWQDHRAWPTVAVFAQRLNAAGLPAWTADGIPVGAATVFKRPSAAATTAHQVMADGTGGVVVAWVDARNEDGSGNADIYAQRLDANGASLWTAGGLPICTRPHDQYQPRIATDGAGGAIFTWEDRGEPSSSSFQPRIQAQRVDASGIPRWAENGVLVSDRRSAEPRLVTDGANGALVVFEVRDAVTGGSRIGLFAQRLGAETGERLWTDDGSVAYDARRGGYCSNGAHAVSDGAGGVIVSWRDCRFAGDADYGQFAQRISDQVLPPADLSETIAASSDAANPNRARRCSVEPTDVEFWRPILKPHGAGSQQIDITPVACGLRVAANPTVHNCGVRCCELSVEKGNGACERKLYGSRLWFPEGIRLRQVYPDNDSIMKVLASEDGTITTGKVTVCGAANADRRACVGARVRSTPPPACTIVTPPPGVPGQGCVDPLNPGGRPH
jgi:hypothetical protein